MDQILLKNVQFVVANWLKKKLRKFFEAKLEKQDVIEFQMIG